MTTNTHNTDPVLQHYLNSIGQTEHPVLTALRERTQSHRLGKMAIAQEQGNNVGVVGQIIECPKIFGSWRLYRLQQHRHGACPPRRRQNHGLDINVTFTDIARETWRAAGVAHKISLHLQPALLTLDDLIAQGESESYDLALIDADKPPTPKYFERCLQLVRSGGVIAIDNILLGGRVMNEAAENDPPAWISCAISTKICRTIHALFPLPCLSATV